MTDDFLLYKCGVQEIEVACQLYASGYFFNFILFEFLLESVVYLLLVCAPFLGVRLTHKYLHSNGGYLRCDKSKYDKHQKITEMSCRSLMFLSAGFVFLWVTIPVTLLSAELLSSPAEVEGFIISFEAWTQNLFL